MGKVTREMIRAIGPGQTAVFAGLSARAVESGKAQVFQVARLDGMKFSVSGDYRGGRLTVTRTM